MKGSPNLSYDLEELRAILTKAGLIKRDAELDLRPYKPAFTRRSAHRHSHYLVSSKQKAVCHLVVGKNLALLHARARDFAAACPKLACRPLLYHEGSGSIDYLCLEHFAGESLDVAVQSGRCSASEWLKTTRRAQELLERTGEPSDPTRLQGEIDTLLKNACAFPGFSDVDARLLLELAQPILLETTAGVPLVERWSTGDFVGRNLLVDAAGGLRLIDYDHALRTHFGRADWLRLMQFSILPPGLDVSSIKELQFTHRPAHEVYLWLHQLSLLREAEPTEETKRHFASMVQNLFAAVDRATGRKSSARAHSFLIGALVDQQVETESALQERTVWAKSLEQDLHSTRQNFEKLTVEYAERTTWAKSLEEDVAKARTAHQEQVQVVTKMMARLSGIKNACAALAAVFPAWAELDEIALLERSLRTLVDQQRELAAKNAAINTATAATLHAQLDAKIANTETLRLTSALADAQLHVDGLLRHTEQLQKSIHSLHTTQRETETALREKAELLNSSIAELQTTRAELSRYESRLICRLAARPPVVPSSP